jgi:Flp pilus assembly protein TadG
MEPHTIHPAVRRRRPRCRTSRRGLVLIYSIIFLMALLAVASLAVDYGHAQLAKFETQRAADLAARAAALQLASGGDPVVAAAAALARAQAVAGWNSSDSAPLLLGPNDVTVGNYDKTQTPVYQVGRLPLNAVTVSIERDGVVNPTVPLTLAPMVGMQTITVKASAEAHVVPPPSPYGMVGLNSVTFGSVGVLAKVVGDLVSNGPVSVGTPLGIGVTVTGNAQSFNSSTSKGSAALVSGVMTPMSSALNFPSAVAPLTNNNSRIAAFMNGYNDFTMALGGTVPAGTYVVRNLNMVAGIAVNVSGPVVFYVTGALNLAAGVNLLGATNTEPSNFIVYIVAGGTVVFVGNLLTPVAMEIYAPDSDIVVAVGVSSFKGMLIGKTLNIALPILGTFTEVKPTATPPQVTTDS